MLSFKMALGDFIELLENGTVEIVSDNGVPSHPNTIYEGSQGLLLDQDIGFFPHVTRSTVGRRRLDNFIFHYDDIWYVTRAYQTRHGEGPMTNLGYDLVLQNATAETNFKNEWQGEFRRTYLDVDLLKYALQQDRKGGRRVQAEYLVITCLDQMLEWKFTEGRILYEFQNEQEFVENLVQALGFKGMVYLSRSSEGNLIEWKGGNK
jgi:adenylosuccinate synthase